MRNIKEEKIREYKVDNREYREIGSNLWRLKLNNNFWEYLGEVD
jgi:hypothetical protein